MQTDRFYTEPTSGHVSLERLRRYQTDALPLSERHQVEKHLLDCELCTDLLEGLEASPVPVTQRAVQDINRRLADMLARKKRRVPFYAQPKNWSVAAAILIFMLTGAVVVYYNLATINQAEKNTVARASEAQQKSATVIKPATPLEVESNQPIAMADSTQNNPGTAFRAPEISSASRPHKQQLPTTTELKKGQLAEAIVRDTLTNSKLAFQGPSALISDTLAVATALKAIEPESGLFGTAADVQMNKSKLTVRGAPARGLHGSSSIASRVITGKVTDDTGEALPGATVVVKGTSVGAVTNARGEYTITLPENSNKATLAFSFIGYDTTEKQIDSLTAPSVALNIQMKTDAKALSEVVVVGYGTQSKSSVTGAIAYAKPSSGFKAFRKYVQQNLKYPEAAKEKKVKGRVVVGFTVNPNGVLSDFRIIKSLSPECDAEALRLIKEGPAWEPTKKDEVAVSEQVRMAIRFRLTR